MNGRSERGSTRCDGDGAHAYEGGNHGRWGVPFYSNHTPWRIRRCGGATTELNDSKGRYVTVAVHINVQWGRTTYAVCSSNKHGRSRSSTAYDKKFIAEALSHRSVLKLHRKSLLFGELPRFIEEQLHGETLASELSFDRVIVDTLHGKTFLSSLYCEPTAWLNMLTEGEIIRGCVFPEWRNAETQPDLIHRSSVIRIKKCRCAKIGGKCANHCSHHGTRGEGAAACTCHVETRSAWRASLRSTHRDIRRC